MRMLGVALVLAPIVAAQYSATYRIDALPETSEQGQTGTNRCGTTDSQDSMCQTAHVNNLNSFCLWAPPTPDREIGESERVEVAWCTDGGYGTRTIPPGTLSAVHLIQTPDYVQITGKGDLTKLNIRAGDAGGELDPHGPDGNGNPVGGLLFSDAFGPMQQIHEWTNFMSADIWCIRVCNPAGNNPAGFCQHIYDVMGCEWNMPANYGSGFDQCLGDSTEPMGVYNGHTFRQGDRNTPAAHQPGDSSQCTTATSIDQLLAPLSIQGVTRTTSLPVVNSTTIFTLSTPTRAKTVVPPSPSLVSTSVLTPALTPSAIIVPANGRFSAVSAARHNVALLAPVTLAMIGALLWTY